MKKYMLVQGEQEAPEEIRKLCGTVVRTAEEAVEKIEKEQNYNAVLIHLPSTISGIQSVIDLVEKNNSDLLAFPILILTDAEHIAMDEQYLGGVVVDCVEMPVRPAVFRNRLANAEQLVSSVSFSEFANMLRALPAIIYLKDAKARYVFSSQTWHHLETGDDPDWTIRGKTDPDIRKDKENAQKALESDRALIRSGKGTSYIIEENDGEQEFLQIIKEPLFHEDGRVRGIIALINVVTEQEQLRRKLREQYITDQLTGLHNRSYYSECIEKLKEETPEDFSVIVADCDHLKFINDTFGHMAGNEYIRCCAELLKTCLPESAMVFRTGGDEFVAFLPGTDEKTAASLVDRIRENQSKYQIKGNTLSVSIGCSTMAQGDSLEMCIERADNDMYRDKLTRKMNMRKQGGLL